MNNRIAELTTEIDKLYAERKQLIRAKTVTYGELLDAINKLFKSDRYSDVYFANKLNVAINSLHLQGENNEN